MKPVKVYLSPKSVAEHLKLTDIRLQTPEGLYVLSSHDISAYGREDALRDGAVEMLLSEYKEKYNPQMTQ